MQDCKHCSFTDIDADGLSSYGQDLIDMSVWLKKYEATGKVVMESSGWGEIQVNNCPVCGSNLGGFE